MGTNALLDLLFMRPVVNVGLATDELGLSFGTANNMSTNSKHLEC